MNGTVRSNFTFGWLLACAWLIFAKPGTSQPANDPDLSNLKRAVLTNYTVIVSAAYRDAVTTAQELQSAIETLLDAPSETSLGAARQAWLAAHQVYSLTEACRFYDGPIDQVEALVNSWPIDARYIDSVPDDPNSGIINDVAQHPILSRELVVALNEKDGKKNVSTGFHAIEFLLWGQPPSSGGPGLRSWRDFDFGAQNVERRRVYLSLITQLLVEHLQTVADAWAQNRKDNYRAQFLAQDSDTALANVLKGLGALSGPEVSGERLTSAYETKEREEQQDCFSDNSCADLVADALGIQNVFLGRYQRFDGCTIEGPAVVELIENADPAFANKLLTQIVTAVAAARAIPPPFDQAIVGTNISAGRLALKKAIVAFQTQSDLVAQAAKVLSLRLNI